MASTRNLMYDKNASRWVKFTKCYPMIGSEPWNSTRKRTEEFSLETHPHYLTLCPFKLLTSRSEVLSSSQWVRIFQFLSLHFTVNCRAFTERLSDGKLALGSISTYVCFVHSSVTGIAIGNFLNFLGLLEFGASETHSFDLMPVDSNLNFGFRSS